MKLNMLAMPSGICQCTSLINVFHCLSQTHFSCVYAENNAYACNLFLRKKLLAFSTQALVHPKHIIYYLL